MIEALFATALGASAIFSFWWFWKTNPGLKLWWVRTPTSHALVFGTIALGLASLQFSPPFLAFLSQFSGILLIGTGFGYCTAFFFIHRTTKQRPAQSLEANLLIYAIHLFAGGAGIYLFTNGFSSIENTLLPLAVAFTYLGIIGIGFLNR